MREVGSIARDVTKMLSVSSTRKKAIQPGPGRRNVGPCGLVGDEPRGAGGAVAASRVSPSGGMGPTLLLRSAQPALGGHAVDGSRTLCDWCDCRLGPLASGWPPARG